MDSKLLSVSLPPLPDPPQGSGLNPKIPEALEASEGWGNTKGARDPGMGSPGGYPLGVEGQRGEGEVGCQQVGVGL